MNRIKSGRPTPAFVIAVVALFVSLGGTGYAAKQITVGSSKTKAGASVTKAQVNKMIASYFTKHRAELKGEQGQAGAAGKNGESGARGAKGDQGDKGEKGDQGVRGEKGETGPQGPGAINLTTSLTEIGTHALATVGPWTVTLTCNPSAPNSTLTIKGPGELTQSVTTGASPVLSSVVIGAGKSLTVNNGGQLAETGFLTSGTTTYELNVQMTAEQPLIETCPVVGDAILVPAAS
jgi:collagen triple helix repeat protein